ncbi:uncharacterized protein LOC110038624 [Phalaenopsis equestris]|uniref:uncharacterized protein LOC110038624 n=1 Tax=Phalaenopsis equestris TaxID=78828 RepID=UPI0009E5EE61|nr:uncharacterized protein LOC110038624 [Phalaenopsis equestris]
MWNLHPNFINEIMNAWTINDDYGPWIKLWKLKKKVAIHLRNWNWNTFGDVNENLKTAQNKVLCTEEDFQRGLKTEIELHKANEELLAQITYHETFLKKKAAMTKFTEGDRNSSFFHVCINFKRKCNMILEIKNSEGIKLTKADDIALDAVNFFQQLFNTHPTIRTCIDANLFAEGFDYVSRLTLDQIPLEDEIRDALDSIDDDKTAGPNGYTAKFYKSFKSYWTVVKQEVISVIQEFFRGNNPPRIQPHLQQLVCANQTAFIKGRSIFDNILLAQEMLLDLDRKCRRGNAIYKLDIKKAYDAINWNFILETLAVRGFAEGFTMFIKRWLLCNNHSVLINGSCHGFFSASRGIK